MNYLLFATLLVGDVRLVDQNTHNKYLELVKSALDINGDIVFYDEKSMPPAYQDWDGALRGIHNIYYNISGKRDRGEPFGNANREFPWGSPFGLHHSSDFSTFRFFVLPKGKKIKYWREVLPQDQRISSSPGSIRWRFPYGTAFGEVLLISERVFEIRTRTRGDGETASAWRPKVYRPYSSKEHLEELIGQKLEKTVKVSAKNNGHVVSIFDESDNLVLVPKLEKAQIDRVFASPLRETDGFAPYSDHSDIVPAKYVGGLTRVSSISCNRCHATVQKHANDFQPNRDWYGRVRGSDSIFSFHIFAPGEIRSDGFPHSTGNVALREELLNILESK